MSKHQFSQTIVDASVQELDKLAAAARGIAVLTTADGFQVASTTSDDKDRIGKLAAISSSIYGMAAAIAKESGVEPCEIVSVEGLSGVILVVEVPGIANGMLLAVVASKTSMLGELRWMAATCGGHLAKLLSGQ